MMIWLGQRWGDPLYVLLFDWRYALVTRYSQVSMLMSGLKSGAKHAKVYTCMFSFEMVEDGLAGSL